MRTGSIAARHARGGSLLGPAGGLSQSAPPLGKHGSLRFSSLGEASRHRPSLRSKLTSELRSSEQLSATLQREDVLAILMYVIRKNGAAAFRDVQARRPPPTPNPQPPDCSRQQRVASPRACGGWHRPLRPCTKPRTMQASRWVSRQVEPMG